MQLVAMKLYFLVFLFALYVRKTLQFRISHSQQKSLYRLSSSLPSSFLFRLNAKEEGREEESSASSAESKEEERVTVYFSREDEPTTSSARLRNSNSSTQRFLLFNLLALVLATGANFLNLTSFLMSSTSPSFFRSLGLDQLYAINGYMRSVDLEDEYSFLYPSSWVKDRYIVLAEARERETPRLLRRGDRGLGGLGVRPDTAFGPMRGNGRENLSVVKSSVMPGFSLEGTLGSPRAAAEKLLNEAIAPAGSGKIATLLDAYEYSPEEEEGKSGSSLSPLYIFEYTVQREGAGEGGFFQHSLSAIASRGTELYTLTFMSPESSWDEKRKEEANTVVRSFQLTSRTATPSGFY